MDEIKYKNELENLLSKLNAINKMEVVLNEFKARYVRKKKKLEGSKQLEFSFEEMQHED